MSRNYGVVCQNESVQRIMVKYEGGQDQLVNVRLKISLLECNDKVLLDKTVDESTLERFF